MNETKKEYKQAQAVARMLRSLQDFPALAAATSVAMLGELAFVLARPWVLGRAVESLERIGAGSDALAAVATRYGLLFLALTAAMNVLRFFYGFYRGKLVQSVVAKLRLDSDAKLHLLSPSFYTTLDSGAVLARVSRDIQKMRPFFGMVVFSTVHLVLVVFGSLALMAVHSPALAAATMACFSLSLALMFRTATGLRPLNRAADDQYDAVSLDIKENIEGVRVVKTFGREEGQKERFSGRLGKYVDKTLRAADYWSLRMPLSHSAFGICVPLILVIGGWQHVEGGLAKGAIVACLFYAARVFHELNGMTRLVSVAQEAAVSSERLYELLDSKQAVSESDTPLSLVSRSGRLRFEKVSFAYEGNAAGARGALRGLDLDIRAGERVAIVGPTGSGKSTMASLLLRFFDPSAGRILFDGTDIRSIPLEELRRAVGCVFQETFLFSGTLKENLAYARPEATDAEIRAALETAQLGDFVGTLPEGLETVVGERGVTLSGGQKQRVAIARTLLADPALLILDDATASVDADTEAELVGALQGASRGRTTLVITQRLSGVLLAERAVVLEGGRVSDAGTHDELLERSGIYKELFLGQVLETKRDGNSDG